MKQLFNLQKNFTRALFEKTPKDFLEKILCGALDIEESLSIYRYNIFHHYHEALKEMYPAIQILVGEDFFQALSKAYAMQYPSTSASLHEFGQNFAGFLGTFPRLSDFPYLPEVAQFEWARHEVFYEEDAPAFDFDALSKVPKSAYSRIKFVLNPACRILTFQFPVLQIYEAVQKNLAIALKDQGENILVIRKETGIHSEVLTPAAFAFLACFQQAKNFQTACKAALQRDSHFSVDEILQKHLLQKTIVGFS